LNLSVFSSGFSSFFALLRFFSFIFFENFPLNKIFFIFSFCRLQDMIILPGDKMKRKMNCRCLHCRTLFTLDSYNKHSQRYCNRTDECRRASHCAASKKYRNSRKGDDAFRKGEVERVRGWRRRNPGYGSKNKEKRKKDKALRDIVQEGKSSEWLALRDTVIYQQACFQGLVSFVTGALRDDIGTRMNAFYDKGIARSKEGCATKVKEGLHDEERDCGPGSAQARA
jgi:hypothetical protein